MLYLRLFCFVMLFHDLKVLFHFHLTYFFTIKYNENVDTTVKKILSQFNANSPKL